MLKQLIEIEMERTCSLRAQKNERNSGPKKTYGNFVVRDNLNNYYCLDLSKRKAIITVTNYIDQSSDFGTAITCKNYLELRCGYVGLNLSSVGNVRHAEPVETQVKPNPSHEESPNVPNSLGEQIAKALKEAEANKPIETAKEAEPRKKYQRRPKEVIEAEKAAKAKRKEELEHLYAIGARKRPGRKKAAEPMKLQAKDNKWRKA